MGTRWRCGNHQNCPPPHGFQFEADEPGRCPRCGRQGMPYVVPLTDVHFLAVDNAGPLAGHSGTRYRQACKPKRDTLAPNVNIEEEPFTRGHEYAATNEPWAVTCPSCMATSAFRVAAAQVPGLTQELERRSAIQVMGGGCC